MLALFGTRLEPARYNSVVVLYIAWIGSVGIIVLWSGIREGISVV